MRSTWLCVSLLLLALTSAACADTRPPPPPPPPAAWDCFYDGSVLPTDPSLGANRWGSGDDVSLSSTDGNLLHLVNGQGNDLRFAKQFGMAAHTPFTFETRVSVVTGGAAFVIIVPGAGVSIGLQPGGVDVGTAPGVPRLYITDLTMFRTIRVAIDPQGQSYVWLGGQLLDHGVSSWDFPNCALAFQNYSYVASDSYWDYIGYSAAFLPVPEPSSLLALAGGIAGLGGLALRRKRR